MTNINTFQGNVGIGTDNPDEKLEVVQGGSIKLSGDYINSTAKLYIDRVGNATWGTSGDYDAFRFFETRNTSASEYFNAVKIGASGIAIGYDPPLYSRAGVDSLICSGRVGIGTIAPQDIAHIYKNGGNDDHGLLIEQMNSGTGSAYLKFGVAHTNESTAGLSKAGIFFKRADTNGRGDLLFCIDNANDTNDVDTSNHALTIYRTGNVGIGTTDPDARLHLEEPSAISATTRLFHTENGFTGGSVGHFEIIEKKTGAGTGWSDFTLRLQRRVDATEQGYIEFNPTGNSGDYGIAFGNPSGGGPGEIMRIDGINGRVGIMTTNPVYPLDVNGGVRINNRIHGQGQSSLYFDNNNEPKLFSAASTQFLFATNGYAYGTLWVDTSDRRLKKNIEPLNNALDTLKKLNPVHYEKRYTETMVCDEECKEEKCYQHEDGFIAQEVQEIPELAHAVSHPESTDMLGLNYNSILAYCVKAVQEQQTIIETEKAKVADLLARVIALENTETSNTEATTETSNTEATTETSNTEATTEA